MIKEDKISKKDIIEFLYKEKDCARLEVLANISTVNQMSLILIPFFFAGVGLLLGSVDVKISKITDKQFSLLLIIISQIMFLLWMYALSIVANMAAVAGYIMTLEEKINAFAGEKIAQWESVVQNKYIIKSSSVQVVCTFFWNFLYLALFVWMTIVLYVDYLNDRAIFFYINCGEIILIVVVYFLLRRIRNKAYKLTKDSSID